MSSSFNNNNNNNKRFYEFEDDGVTPLVGSTSYSTREYWDHRFTIEPSKEWLASFTEIKDVLLPLLLPGPRGRGYDSKILLVGNGNSNLAIDLFDSGFTNITASDYSKTVIEKMREKHRLSHPSVRYVEADMLDIKRSIDLKDEVFDIVIDKAGMDAIIADGGDSWNPTDRIKESVLKVCKSVYDVLMHPNGLFIQVSFSQPHFRGKLLLQQKWKEVNSVLDSSSASLTTTTLSSTTSSSTISSSSFLPFDRNLHPPESIPIIENKDNKSQEEADENEWEEDKQPGIGRSVGESITATTLNSTDGTYWSSFAVKEISVGLGYYLFIAQVD